MPAFGGPASTTVNPSRNRSPLGRSRRSPICLPDRSNAQPYLVLSVVRHILLVGKVERRFEARQDLKKLFPPGLDLLAEPALELAQGLLALRFGLRVDQVGQALRSAEVHATVEERPPGEFAGIGSAAARDAVKRPYHRIPCREAAMDVEFRLVFPGKALRTGQAMRQAPDRGCSPGSAFEIAQHEAPRRGDATRHRFQDLPGCGPADADDADRSATMSRGCSENRIGDCLNPSIAP